MAGFIDEREEEIELEEGEELESFDESTEESEEQTEEVFGEEPETSIPDKYQGKEPKDIIAMHQNAEKLLGKQSQEVGELRKIVDDFIQTQTVSEQKQQSPESTEEFDEVDFFENPQSAINKMLENHPSVKQSQAMAANIQKQETIALLKANFPAYTEIVTDPAFGEWIGKSKVRTTLLREADQNFNYEAAEELFSLWQERKGMVEQAVKSEKTARKQAVKTASTGSAKGSGERSSRKIYRRADIIELMQKDPTRYAALAGEIRQAYTEGRVK